MPKTGQKKVTEPSRDNKRDNEATLDDYLGRPEHQSGEDYAKGLESSRTAISEGMKAFIELDLGREINVEIADHFSTRGDDPNSSRDDEPSPDSHHGQIEEIVRSILEENKNPSQEQAYSTTTRVALALGVLALAGAAGTLAMYLLKRYAKKQGDADITSVTDVVKAALRQMLEDQNAQPDRVFWTHLADFVDNGVIVNGNKVQLTIADQLVLQNFVIAISPLNDGWDWGASVNEYKNAEAIKQFYDTSKKISDCYRHVLDVPFEGRALPRAVAARQLQMVLGWIYSELR